MPKGSGSKKKIEIVYIRKGEPSPDTATAPNITTPLDPAPAPAPEPSAPAPAPAPEPSAPAPAPAPAEMESIAPTTLQKQKKKRQMTEARKAHLQRLAELNRKRREEAKRPPPVEVPPPDAKPVVVREKRPYKKQDKEFWEAIITAPEKKAEVESLPKNEIIYPPVVDLEPRRPRSRLSTPAPPRPRTTPPLDYPPAKGRVVVRPLKDSPKVVKSRAPLRPKRQPLYESESEESDEESEESEESSDEEVERYVQKTHKRISTLDKIDQRLKALRNPYEAYGLSAF